MSYTNGLDKPSDFFNTVLYTGNSGSGDNVVNVNFQPDFTWFKSRTQAYPSYLIDAVRGDEKYLNSSNNNAEASWGVDDVTWTSTGFTLNTTGGSGINEGGQGANNMVAWNWKAGTSFTNDASATGIGSMDSAGSVNEEAGFAIVSYTGNETASTLKHGLSTVPQMIIVKGLISARDWIVGHHTQGWTKSAMLNETTAYSNQTHWNNTAPTSSVFTIEGGSNSNVNTNNAAYIAYIFSERQGYSKFGSYTGNGNANGAFVYTGFKPAFVMVKRTDASAHWRMFDNKREGYNVDNDALKANTTDAETTTDFIDLLSNGFKLRSSDSAVNGGTVIYMAFASNPFVTSTGVPATAR